MASAAVTESAGAGGDSTTTTDLSSVASLLEATPGSAFARDSIIEIEAETSATDALKVLQDSGVSSAPVYQEEYDAVQGAYPGAVVIRSRRYIGFVDGADLAALVVSKGLKRPSATGLLSKLSHLFSADREHSVDQAINLSERNPFYGLPLTGNVLQAAKVMARKNIHRMAVIDTAHENRVHGVVTQMDILKLVNANMSTLGSLASMPVGHLFESNPAGLVSAPHTATLREVLELLLSRHVTGLPLIDQTTGQIVDNISVSDVRTLGGMTAEEADAALEKPAMWVVTHGGKAPPETADSASAAAESVPSRAPLVVKTTDSIATAITLMVKSCKHRLYIVDAAHRPVGVISTVDIVRLLVAPHRIVHDTSAAVSAAAPAGDAAGAGAGESASAAAAAAAAAPTGGPSTAPEAPALADHLRSVKVHEFCSSSGVLVDDLVDVPSGTSAADVLKLLSDKKVSSVAVYQEETVLVPGIVGAFAPVPAMPMTLEKKYLGWVDAADIAALTLDDGLRESHSNVWSAICSVFKSDTAHSADAAMNRSNTDAFWAIPVGRSMDQVVRVLGNCRMHRLAVVDTDDRNRVTGLITQSAVVRHLATQVTAFGGLESITMAYFAKDPASIITVPVSASGRDAVRTVIGARVSGVPVVDASGAVVDIVSVQEMRALAHVDAEDVEDVLKKPVRDMLIDLRRRTDSSSTLVELRATDAFTTGLSALAASGAHRAVVVNDERQPIGIMTLTGALKLVASAI